MTAENETDHPDHPGHTDILIKRNFEMTISNLQRWLDENSIDALQDGCKKRSSSPTHKQYNSPQTNKSKAFPLSPQENHDKVSSSERSAPFSRNLKSSPLTPQDDEKHNATRPRISEKHQKRERQQDAEQLQKKSGSLLLTPELNKTGVSKLDTPSKVAMRDEIRSLLDDNSPVRAMKTTDAGITPGGLSDYDADELKNVLSDLRRENDKAHSASPSRVKVFHPKSSPKSLVAVAPPRNQLKNECKANCVAVNTICGEQERKSAEKGKQNPHAFPVKSPSHLFGGISPSIPVANAQPLQPDGRGTETISNTFRVLKLLFPTVCVATIAWIFVEIGGVWKLVGVVGEPTLLCDRDSTQIASISSNVQYECEPCPEHAVRCSHGRATCQTNYILQDNKCILDDVLVKFAFEIKRQAVQILSERRGKYECGEFFVDGYTMHEDELFSNVEIFDTSKKYEAFSYFKEKVLSDQALIGVNDGGKYFSYNKSIKSPLCKINEWVWSNVPFLVAALCLMVLFVVMYFTSIKRQNNKKQLKLMANEIYKILEEHRDYDRNQHVPVDLVRERLRPKSNSIKMWREVEHIICKDSRITKSVRMIDGTQRNCWKMNTSSHSSSNKMRQIL